MALSVTLGAHAAESDDAPAPIAVVLEYDSPASCSRASDFESALRARSNRIALLEDAPADTLMRVRIRSSPDGVIGRLQLVQGGVASDPRFVRSEDCSNVVEALALTAVLSLAPSSPGLPALDAVGVEPPEWEVRVGARAETAKVVDSHFAFGAGLGLSAERDTAGLWTWWLSLGASFLTTRPTASDAYAFFELTTAQLWVCPLRFGGPLVSLRPCLNAQLGTLSGRGQNLAEAREASSVWGSAGPSLILHVDPVSRLRLELIGGAALPLHPQDYTINAPEVPVTSTSVVAPWFGLGLAYRL